METYTKEEINEGIGCFTQHRTVIGKIIGCEKEKKYITWGYGEIPGSGIEIVGYAHPDDGNKKRHVKWL